ncbi:MAG: hypothetical protein AUK51_00785 [Comamonadaceae bacterium CG2_30_59_20]|nr:MAG: hypothetical protein AUK51_00785 [Comamonadaceae bacterium CG2_30_59_20]
MRQLLIKKFKFITTFLESQMQINNFTTIVLSTAFLTACGGGGGGNDGPAPVAATAALTSTTQDVAAQEVVSTALAPLELVQTLTGAQTTDEGALFRFALAQKSKLPTYLMNASKNSTLVGVVQTETVACTYGGSLYISASVANPNGEPTAGDSATITGNNCVEADGTISGSLRLTFNSLSGNFNTDYYSASITLSFDNLAIASAQINVRANGSFALAEAANGYNNLQQTYSTPSLSVSADYAGEARTRTLSGFQATATRTSGANDSYATSYSLNGAVTSSAMASQTLMFNTITPFVEFSDDLYPSSGVLLITGAANAQLRLTAINSSQVTQELDANGDGSFEGNKTVYWSSLL